MLKNKLNSTFAANMAQPRSRTRDLSRLFSAPVNFGDTNRDDSKSYGYPDALTFDLMYNAYNRGGFFKAVVILYLSAASLSIPLLLMAQMKIPSKTVPLRLRLKSLLASMIFGG